MIGTGTTTIIHMFNTSDHSIKLKIHLSDLKKYYLWHVYIRFDFNSVTLIDEDVLNMQHGRRLAQEKLKPLLGKWKPEPNLAHSPIGCLGCWDSLGNHV